MSVRSPNTGQSAPSLPAIALGSDGLSLLSGALFMASLACATIVAMDAVNGSDMAGWCLGAPRGARLIMLSHFPWCYSALTFTAFAVAMSGLRPITSENSILQYLN